MEHDHLLETDPVALTEAIQSGRVKISTPAESCLHILRGLVSYHERMTMGSCPERDFYLDALRFAISCVEEKIPKEDAANG